jgi:flagellar biosynthesis chaperone FliJ
MRRLLRIRELEEEQSRLALESAMGDVHRLEHARVAGIERDRRGRQLVHASIRSGEFRDRLAGLEESRAADRIELVLAPRIADAEQEVSSAREDYLSSRVERRQAETLIEEAEARETADRERRSQQALDDWYRNRLHRADGEGSRAEPGRSGYPWSGHPWSGHAELLAASAGETGAEPNTTGNQGRRISNSQ